MENSQRKIFHFEWKNEGSRAKISVKVYEYEFLK